ncbi:MAG: hypothetical protein D6675_06135 [Gemmatimonadetes bacterium]|nr:MAG: hypothetical protein D6675_06135 [Gemmatimonadota bacterium]
MLILLWGHPSFAQQNVVPEWQILTPLDSLEQIQLHHPSGVRQVYTFTRHQPVLMRVKGPGDFRGYVCLDYTEHMPPRAYPFQLGIYVDGRLANRYELEARPDPQSYYRTLAGKTGLGLLPSQLIEKTITVPVGEHLLEVRLMGGDDLSAKGYFEFAPRPERSQEIVTPHHQMPLMKTPVTRLVERLQLKVGVRTFYDDNILQLNSTGRDQFLANTPAPRWDDLTSLNDVITMPSLHVQWGMEPDKPRWIAGLAGVWYATNGSLNRFITEVQYHRQWGSKSRVSIACQTEFPHLARNLLYTEDAVSQYRTAHRWMADLSVNYQRQWRSQGQVALYLGNHWTRYDAPFQNRSYRAYQAGAQFFTGPLWHGWQVVLGGSYRLAPATTPDDQTDVSHRGLDVGVGLQRQWQRLHYRLDYQFSQIDFESDVAKDVLHHGRTDQVSRIRVELTYNLTSRTTGQVFYHQTDHQTKGIGVSAAQPHPGDRTGFQQHQFGITVSYQFLSL